ncbi:competence protein CoiA family protein [Streptomyces sp. 8N114]|uniref:competence protein CoiA family protein n=1 Tax=Streptomyces sp. 8N114 TaxID=3457419 RepID=UPI003FD662D7
MPLTALHTRFGLLDATCEDLDAGLGWETIYRVRPRAPLHCTACHGPVHAKLSRRGRRFFAHDSAAPRCPSHGESPEHRRLKRALALAARRAGWRAELEVAGEGWRADVLATEPSGRRLALEAQLSPITYADITDRTYRYAASGVEVCWVTDTEPPWLMSVPSLQVTAEENGQLRILDGHRALSSKPVTRLCAVDLDGDRADHDVCGLRWQHWEQALPRTPVPWYDPWRLLAVHRPTEDDSEDEAPLAIPRANTFRAHLGWWRPNRQLTVERFLTALRHDQITLLELASPFRDISSNRRDALVWTTHDYLERATKLTAFAYGWRLYHRSEPNRCPCRSGETYVLSADDPAGHLIDLCSQCDRELVELASDIEDWEGRGQYVSLVADSPLVYLTPWQRQLLAPSVETEVRIETGITPQEAARRLTGYDG